MPPLEALTADGYDLVFGTNVVGHFYFTKLLLPLMIESAKSSPDGKARVVNTSSSNHLNGKLDFELFRDCPRRRKLTGFSGSNELYAQSKLVSSTFH